MSQPDLQTKVDLSNCDQEPIHVPGAIQPHGLLVACDARQERISHVSENCEQFCGKAAHELLGQPVTSLFRGDDLSLSQMAVIRSIADSKPTYLFTVGLKASVEPFDAIAHRNGESIFLEFERSPRREGHSASDLYRLVQRASTDCRRRSRSRSWPTVAPARATDQRIRPRDGLPF